MSSKATLTKVITLRRRTFPCGFEYSTRHRTHPKNPGQRFTVLATEPFPRRTLGVPYHFPGVKLIFFPFTNCRQEAISTPLFYPATLTTADICMTLVRHGGPHGFSGGFFAVISACGQIRRAPSRNFVILAVIGCTRIPGCNLRSQVLPATQQEETSAVTTFSPVLSDGLKSTKFNQASRHGVKEAPLSAYF